VKLGIWIGSSARQGFFPSPQSNTDRRYDLMLSQLSISIFIELLILH